MRDMKLDAKGNQLAMDLIKKTHRGRSCGCDAVARRCRTPKDGRARVAQEPPQRL